MQSTPNAAPLSLTSKLDAPMAIAAIAIDFRGWTDIGTRNINPATQYAIPELKKRMGAENPFRNDKATNKGKRMAASAKAPTNEEKIANRFKMN